MLLLQLSLLVLWAKALVSQHEGWRIRLGWRIILYVIMDIGHVNVHCPSPTVVYPPSPGGEKTTAVALSPSGEGG